MEALAVTPGFWNGKRVFLTGHTGFKGAWLALWLHSLGAKVRGYSKDIPTEPSLFEAARVGSTLEHQTADVRDLQALSSAFEQFRPEAVLHLAAQSLVRYSYEHPLETYATNVMGTVHVLEAVRRTPSVKAVVIVTSDKCYENVETQRGYVESDSLGGHDPYSSSKGCAELVTSAFRASFFGGTGNAPVTARIASARAGNVIGGGDWSRDRLIPDIYRSVIRNEPVRIRNPRAVRPWQHVLEPAGSYLLLAQRLMEGDSGAATAWNFGPARTDARPVSEVLDRVKELWGTGMRWATDEGPHPHEAQILYLDCTKAREELGWRPRLSFEMAVEWTVRWYKAYLAGEDPRRLSEEQIRQYQALGAS